jgi:nitrate reductase beta subunit
MFGPGVEKAIDTYAKPDHELLGVLQLFGSTQKLVFSYEVQKDEVVGYGKRKQVVVRVPIEDPVIIRSEKHLNVT